MICWAKPSALLAAQLILHRVLLKPQEQARKLLTCNSGRFLPSFLKGNVAAPPALSWLMRAQLAIFSLSFVKCGCKKLLGQLHSRSAEQDGAAAVW